MPSPPSSPSTESSSRDHAAGHGQEMSATSSTFLMSSPSMPSSSSLPLARPGNARADTAQPLSWISPEDFDSSTMFEPPRALAANSGSSRSQTPPSAFGRPMSSGARSRASSFAGLNENLFAGFNPENPRASTSLSINYLPTKFSGAITSGGAKVRPRKRKAGLKRIPTMARGGGVDAFKRGEARMPDDRDDLQPHTGRHGLLDKTDPHSRWTRFKWILFATNSLYSLLALVGMIWCILIWLDIIDQSDIVRVANRPELAFTTAAASLALFTCIFGWAGVMLNNRSFLALYTFFLWISLAFLVVPGYLSYKKYSLNLQGKLNFQWSQSFDVDARRRIQNALSCCGYFSPFVEASISSTCYARSVLPGCRSTYFRFEHKVLRWWYVSIFSLFGYNVIAIVSALLCSNHVTYRFGKGMTPKAYRLDAGAVMAIMENYISNVADAYGPDAATQALALSRQSSTVDLSDLGVLLPMGFAREADGSLPRTRYASITSTTPDTAI
ncbi:unnamed protein product [Mycena citricolor]|uniref:Tetraspanin Tsp2 n=1 Tax=Mycena citricolor TaxID=2018698 RepID=A0AAD2HWF6_9AGAR|nr:unnamed protein product [Mycena citricolor]